MNVENVANTARRAGYADAMMDACAVLCGVGLESAKVVEILNKMLEKQAAYKVENPAAS